MLRMLIEGGVDPLEAIRLATLNPAEYFGLHDRGAVAPGRRADFLVVDDLETMKARQVYTGGALVAVDGSPEWARRGGPEPPAPSMAVDWDGLSLKIAAREGAARVIRAIPDQIVTGADRA